MREQKELLRYIRSRVRTREDAADLFQDLGILVLQHPTGPNDASDFKAWCRGLARNMAAHYWRSEVRRSTRTPLFEPAFFHDAMPAPNPDPERDAVLRQSLALCVQDLNERARDLLIRRYVLEETSMQIAGTLRKSQGAIRMRLVRLLCSVRRAAELSDKDPEPIGSR